jgi:hypothetical protein
VRDNWRPGDELYIFGFSRSAYTARSLGGFIARIGWLDHQSSGVGGLDRMDGPEADHDPLPGIDRRHGDRQLDQLLLGELPPRLVVDLVGHVCETRVKASVQASAARSRSV